MGRHRFLVLALGLVIGAVGCKPKLGGRCKTGEVACVDNTTGAFCDESGTYAAMSCSGGCSGGGTTFNCENGVAAVGDGCSMVGDSACTADHKAALLCGKDHKFAASETCKGLRGCAVQEQTVECDNDMADVGDACEFAGDYACTADKALLLRCDDHKMVPLNACRGPGACRIVPKGKNVDFECDDTVAQEGDACDTNGEEACTADRTAELICRSLKFAAFRPCTGAGGCSCDPQGSHFACDLGVAAALLGVMTSPPVVTAPPKPVRPKAARKKK